MNRMKIGAIALVGGLLLGSASGGEKVKKQQVKKPHGKRNQ